MVLRILLLIYTSTLQYCMYSHCNSLTLCACNSFVIPILQVPLQLMSICMGLIPTKYVHVNHACTHANSIILCYLIIVSWQINFLVVVLDTHYPSCLHYYYYNIIIHNNYKLENNIAIL